MTLDLTILRDMLGGLMLELASLRSRVAELEQLAQAPPPKTSTPSGTVPAEPSPERSHRDSGGGRGTLYGPL